MASTAFCLSAPLPAVRTPPRALSPRRRPRPTLPTRPSPNSAPVMRMSTDGSHPVPYLPRLPIPNVRLSHAPLSESVRLQRVSSAVAAMYLPAIGLLVARVFASHMWPGAPLPLPDKLLCAGLLVIAPELMHDSFENLRCCAQVARRAQRVSRAFAETLDEDSAIGAERKTELQAERLVKPVRVHSVLTSVVAAGTLSGLFCSLFRATSGAQITLLFQFVFYMARRVRFERRGRVYRCERRQYRDIVWTCAFASLCVGAVQAHIFPLVSSAIALFVACAFWVLKWIFVPSSARVF